MIIPAIKRFALHKKKKASLVVFLLVFLLGSVVVIELNASAQKAETAHDIQIASSYANAIEKVIQHALSSTNALAVMVHQGHGQVPDYSNLVRYMLPMYKGAFALSLAPEGIIRQIEPALPNKLVQNHDLFEGQDRVAIIKSLHEGELMFWGPFKLIQGPQGAIATMPVFLTNAQGDKYFWGYTVVTLVFPDAFEDVNLKSLEAQGYAYQLSGINPETNKEELIQSSTAPLGDNVNRIPVTLFDMQWALSTSRLTDRNGFGGIAFEFFLVLSGATLMAWLAYSVAALAQQRKKLHDMAMYDPLTHLPNRRLLGINLDNALARARRQGAKVVVCYLDLDGFKAVNDRLGHAAGDLLLKVVSERLQSCLRANDILARMGGDEFVVVLTDLQSVDETLIVLDRIIQTINTPMLISDVQIEVSASVGAAIYQTGGLEADQLLRSADQAMYLAKKSGKNKYVFADDKLVVHSAALMS